MDHGLPCHTELLKALVARVDDVDDDDELGKALRPKFVTWEVQHQRWLALEQTVLNV
jgi:hypothetical protein